MKQLRRDALPTFADAYCCVPSWCGPSVPHRRSMQPMLGLQPLIPRARQPSAGLAGYAYHGLCPSVSPNRCLAYQAAVGTRAYRRGW